MLEVRENQISLHKLPGGAVQLRSCRTLQGTLLVTYFCDICRAVAFTCKRSASGIDLSCREFNKDSQTSPRHLLQ